MKDTKSTFAKHTDEQQCINGTNETNSQPQQEDAASLENDQTQDIAAQPEADTAVNEQTQIKELEAKVAEYLDQLMRSQAELQNYKKRSEREIAQIRSYANEHFASELLVIKDSLETGLQDGGRKEEKKLYEGLELTLKLLQQVFEKFGIQEINPEGEPFDPQRHEAMMTQADASQPPNTVLKVLQKGYLINDRLLRAARVCVSSEPEASSAAQPEPDGEVKNETTTSD